MKGLSLVHIDMMIKPHYIKSVIFLLSILLIPWNGQAQWRKKKTQVERNPYGFQFIGKSKTSHIPFKVYSNLIVLQTTIDNSDTLNFILDTGVSTIFITDPKLADTLGFEFVREIAINGAGQDSALFAKVSVSHQINLKGITGYQQNVVVLNEDILGLSEYMGIPIHGIFGHALFENYVVSIDFGSLIITVKDQKKFKFKKRYGERFPITVTQNKPYTDVMKLVNEDKSESNLRMVIDTGAGHALLLNSQNEEIKLPQKLIRANLGKGLNGDIYGSIGRVPKVKMGKIEMDDVLASFPDSLSFSTKFPPTDLNRQGSIGGDFLRRFVLTLNYPKQYMALKPIKSLKNQPFEHDMSGMDIRAMKGNLDRFYVKEVFPGSQAALAGILANDELIYVNKKHVRDLDLTRIYQILSQKEGKEVDIFYKRDGQIFLAEITLKREI